MCEYTADLSASQKPMRGYPLVLRAPSETLEVTTNNLEVAWKRIAFLKTHRTNPVDAFRQIVSNQNTLTNFEINRLLRVINSGKERHYHEQPPINTKT